MNPLDQMKATLAKLRADLDTLMNQRGIIFDTVLARDGVPTDDEKARTEFLTKDIDAFAPKIAMAEQRIADLTEQAARQATHDAVRVESGEAVERSTTKVTDPDVYSRANVNVSYFRDMYNAQFKSDREALDRLTRHSAMANDAENRALGNTNTTGGSGGEFAPPAWLVNDYIKALRPLRPTADLMHSVPIPAGKSSVNIPKILTGTTVAIQSTQNTALSQTDLTTGYVSTGFTTIGGKQVVSQQLLDQSEIGFDQVIGSDLAADYVRQLDNQVLNGTGTGANNNSVVNGLLSFTGSGSNVVTWNQASPSASQLYGQCAKLIASFATNRFAEPTAWLMHPRRWYSLLAQSDSQGRPLVIPDATVGGGLLAFNPIAENNGSPVSVTGKVGMFLGLPVIVDPLIPTNLGAGTEDRIYLLKTDDLWLYESTPKAEVFRETYADSVGVLFRIFGYIGAIWNRQPFSIGYIAGTGLIAPTFGANIL